MGNFMSRDNNIAKMQSNTRNFFFLWYIPRKNTDTIDVIFIMNPKIPIELKNKALIIDTERSTRIPWNVPNDNAEIKIGTSEKSALSIGNPGTTDKLRLTWASIIDKEDNKAIMAIFLAFIFLLI